MEALILTEIRKQIAFLTINRPQQLNALNKATIEALHNALKAADEDPQVGVIILTGSGEKAFVAGADIKEFADFNIAQGGQLAQIVGRGKANELIFTAGMLKAEEALQWGLVNAVVAQEELLSTCEAMADKILNNSPLAIAAAIRCVNAGFESGKNGYHTEIEEFGKCFGTKDFKEGTTAFLEKRKPNFRG